jgi:hypothetical protein
MCDLIIEKGSNWHGWRYVGDGQATSGKFRKHYGHQLFFSRSDSDLQMWVFGVYANLLESITNCD